MERLVIRGGIPLSGEVHVSGAKNAALPIMAACLLTPEPCVLDNVPMIADIFTMADLLTILGAEVNIDRTRHRVTVCASNLNGQDVPAVMAAKMRASFLVTGPVLARLGKVRNGQPGGCSIGKRPVNVDVRGFEAMGAVVVYENAFYTLKAKPLLGQRIYLDYPSHTGTENILMAATMARGRTVIKNASSEPEVVDLANFLIRMGAHISGAGSSEIEVEGVDELYGVHHRVLPDRIEAGTFAIAAAITGGDVTLKYLNVGHMDPLTHKLQEAGAAVIEGQKAYRVSKAGPLRAVEIQTLHYPGFPTDLQAAFAALLTQANGASIVHERVYDNRLLYAEELRKLGAQVRVSGQTATVTGPCALKGTTVKALDIRCGAALTLAGLAASGETVILDTHHISRGYEALDEKLRALGGDCSFE